MSPEVEIIHFKSMSEKNIFYRFTNNGLDIKTVEDGLESVKSRKAWFPIWMEVGDMYRQLGIEALRENHQASAGEYFIKASLGYHYAQFFHFNDQSEKQQAQLAKIDVHAKAHKLIDPPIYRIQASFEGVNIPIHVRIPSGHGCHPTVILVCGMDSTKEEYFYLENYLLGRGLSVVSFDGPGQGEVWPYLKMRPDYHKAVSAVVDVVSNFNGVDRDRLFLLGLSLGGLLALLAAANDQRIKGCVSNGGFFDLAFFNWENPIRAIGFPYLVGAETIDQAKVMAKDYSLASCVQNIEIPLLIIHGGLDKDAPPEAAKKIIEQARGKGRFVLFPEGIHMCHNISYRVKPLIADWLLDQAGNISS